MLAVKINRSAVMELYMPSAFLSRILPELPKLPVFSVEQPCYYLVGISSDGRPTHKAFMHPEQSAHIIPELSGNNIYISPAVYSDAMQGRKAVNVCGLKTLWLDIDVGKAHNSYATLPDAVAALGRFITDTGCKPTIVVHSGVGLQAYWTLTKTLAPDVWRRLAELFSAFCRQQGLIADPSCTTDMARVLRMPGTLHLKSGNIASVLKDTGRDWEPRELLAVIKARLHPDTAISQPPTTTYSPEAMRLAARATSLGPSEPTGDAELVARNCKAVLSAGLAEEPQWFAMMSVLKTCRNGREWAHKLSAFDKGRYVPADTDAKFNHAADSPTRCATFEAICPGICGQCPHKGKITTPAQLGRPKAHAVEVTPPAPVPAPAPQPEPQVEMEHLHIPDKFEYPVIALTGRNFSVDKDGIKHLVNKKNENGDWETHTELLCSSRLYYTHTVVSQDEQGAEHRVHWFLISHQNSPRLRHVPFEVARDMGSQTIMKWFYENNMFPENPLTPASVFMALMSTYLQSVVGANREIQSSERLGWTTVYDPQLNEDVPAFAVGKGVVTSSGLRDVKYTGVAARVAKEELAKAGDLETWKNIPRMYRILDQKPAQLAVCLAFAAPLMKFGPGTANNGIFSLWSTESGMGKSQVMRACASVWGDPDKQFIQRHSSETMRARKLAVLSNLPCYMDELTDVKDEDMYSLAYTLADGREKQKLKRSGAEMVDTGDWQTVTFTTANKSFKTAAARVAGDSNAALLRVMECECDFKSYAHVSEVNEYIAMCTRLCREHYGLAGPEFMYQVMRHSPRLKTLASRATQWAQEHGFDSAERYMFSACFLALTAGRWAVEWGLLDYDMDALEKWVLEEFVGHNRAATQANTVDHKDLLWSYMLDRQNNTIVVLSKTRPKDTPCATRGMPDRYILNYPIKEAYVRIEREEGNVAISAADLHAWCQRKGVSTAVLLQRMKKTGIHWKHRNLNLAKNIDWATLPSVKTVYFHLDNLQEIMDIESSQIKEKDNGTNGLHG